MSNSKLGFEIDPKVCTMSFALKDVNLVKSLEKSMCNKKGLTLLALWFFLVFPSASYSLDLSKPREAKAVMEGAEFEYQSALGAYKQGDCSTAIDEIRNLMEAYPDIQRFKSDYIAIAVGCGRYALVLSYINGQYEADAPPYVRDSLLKAALEEGNFSKAYLASKWVSGSSGPVVRLRIDQIYSALSDKKIEKADKESRELLELYPQNEAVWDARGYVLRETNQPYQALRVYLEMQRKFPTNKVAPKALANLLINLGMPQLASSVINKNGVSLSIEEQAKLRKEAATRELRWAKSYDHQPKKRYYYTDKSIDDLLSARAFVIENSLGQEKVDAIDFDLVVAYELRAKYQASIALYESLHDQGITIPSYVKLAAADSYSSVNEFAQAESLYRAYLAENPNDSESTTDATLGLYYTLLEQDKFSELKVLVEKNTQEQAESLNVANRRAYAPGEYRGFIESLKDRYTSAEIADAMNSAYQDRLQEANKKIDVVLDGAPASDEALLAKGSIQRWMENPRQAEEYFKIVQGTSSENPEAKIGIANTQFDLRDYKPFKKNVEQLSAEYPELSGVKELVKKQDIYNSPIVTGDFEFANGKASAQDLNAATADLRVYSDPFDDNYRVYARFRGLYSGPAVQSNLSAGAVGLKYSGTGHDIAIEGGDRGYAKIEGTKYIGDSLSGTLSFEKNGFYLFPGALYPIYTGNVAGGIINWKNDDTQRAFVGYQYWSLTNNNQTQAFGSFSQRLLTQYNYHLDASLWIGNQQNTNPNVGYFAPWNQTEYSGTATFEVLQWRNFSNKDYAFWHKLWGTYGGVSQQGYSTLPMNSFGYGQKFGLGDRQNLSWGIGRTYFPFDGVHSNYLTGYLRFEKSF